MIPPRHVHGRLSHKGPVADVLRVGWKKPLGYVSIDSLHETGLDALVVKRRVERDPQRCCYLLEQEECDIWGGALYAYHMTALMWLLGNYRDVLRAADWPDNVRGFVLAVATVGVSEDRDPELYALIGRAFADPRFANGRYVSYYEALKEPVEDLLWRIVERGIKYATRRSWR